MRKKKSKDNLGPVVKLRKAVKINKTLYVALPREFIEMHDIKPGERLPVICNHILKIVPMKEQR
jgi:hypothetical protein